MKKLFTPITDLAASARKAGADLVDKVDQARADLVTKAGQAGADLVHKAGAGIAAALPGFGPPSGEAMDFDEVLAREIRRIDELRVRRRVRARDEQLEDDAERTPTGRAHRRQLVGLAFSGGGIRSATFNLGILQALAMLGLLRHFDYLSTVSGGGYIGGWLTAWIKRRGIDATVAGLRAEHAETSSRIAQPGPAAPRQASPISFLRAYSNYLTPQTGLFSLDTWMAAASYARNTLLNLNVLVLALALVLLLPRLFVALVFFLQELPTGWWSRPWLLPGAMGLLALISARTLAVRLRGSGPPRPSATTPRGGPGLAWVWLLARWRWFRRAWRRRDAAWLTGSAGVQWTVVLPICGLMLLFVFWLFAEPRTREYWPWIQRGGGGYLAFWLLVGAFWFAAWLASGLRLARELRRKPRSRFDGWFWRDRTMHHPRAWLGIWCAAAVAGAASGWLLWLLVRVRASGTLTAGDWLRVTTWAPPGVLAALILTTVYFVGLLGRARREEERQWWSRLSGWLGLFAIGWLALFLAAFYAPPVLRWMGDEAPRLVGSIGLGWLLSTIAGVVAGRSAATSRSGQRVRLELVARTAPYVFVIGLVMLLSLSIDGLLPRVLGGEDTSPHRRPAVSAPVGGWLAPDAAPRAGTALERLKVRRDAELDRDARWLDGRWWRLAGLFALLVIVTTVLSWRVDINEFSMHNFYRDRLTRPYLGASRRRQPDLFTGFDPADDIYLHRLMARETTEERLEREELEKGEPATGRRHPWDGEFDGPYPIVNATLNLSSSPDPAWQERQANSFVFTPQVYGFEPGAGEKRQRPRRSTRAYRPIVRAGQQRRHRQGDPTGITLGSAMTVSGAAVNPNMGYHSSPALAFLMTVFNARLGLWLGNPAHADTWHRKAPTIGLEALLRELLGMTGAHSKWVNLADGGFFDNLGVYELVRRRCRFILACDAEADPDLRFNALGNVIRRCRADFGIEIRFENLDPLRRRDDGPFSRWHCAVGTIHYDRVDRGAPKGILVYVKATLTGDEPADLLNYQRQHPGFPHESTGDQWFGESQFESYRRLGQHIGLVIFRAVGLRPGG